MDKELSLAQAAAIKGVSVGTVRKWIFEDQVLPGYRNGARSSSDHDTRPIYVLESELGKVRQRIPVGKRSKVVDDDG